MRRINLWITETYNQNSKAGVQKEEQLQDVCKSCLEGNEIKIAFMPCEL